MKGAQDLYSPVILAIDYHSLSTNLCIFSNRIHEVEEVKDSEINKLKTNSIKLQEELSQCNMVNIIHWQYVASYILQLIES